MNYNSIDKWQEYNVIAGYTADFGGAWNNDVPEDVPHYEALGKEFGFDTKQIVRVNQTHTDLIMKATSLNGGEGVIRPANSVSYDGIITNEPNFMICVVTADCTPVFLYDSVQGAIGMVHSGRAGTMKEIAAKAVQKMVNEYGSRPEDIQCILGPYLCQQHHEVEEKDIKEIFEHFSQEECQQILEHKGIKFYVDMGRAIRISLERLGVKADNINDLHICTLENKEIPSCRRNRNSNARLLSFIALKR